ncbi:hypothetical protein BBP40_003871 [Aspergillus hancockii]|nr:hypothetical protein BBP40_003871 [Aspergillus hancockii]
MSTQTAQSILFTHTTPQQGFKLLELPPDLADLLTSKEPPTLELKSPSTTPNHATTTSTQDPQEYVNLCTPTKTYLLRQVHSSNSIHIIKPSDAAVSRGDITIVTGDESELSHHETITSISKCGSTLELHVPPEGFSAIPVLEKMLPLYDLIGDGDYGSVDAGAEEIVRRVFADVPVSGRQCQEGWIEIWASIDRARCTQWVGETYLEAMAPTSAFATGRSVFLNAWKDLLPESWRADVACSKLTVSEMLPACYNLAFYNV